MFINLLTTGNGGSGSTVPSGVTELVVVNNLTDVTKYGEILDSLVRGVDLPYIYVYKGYHKDIYFTNAEVTTRAKGSGTATATGVLFSCVDVVSGVTTRYSYFIFQDGTQLFYLGLYEDKVDAYEPVVFSYSGLTDVASGTTLLCSDESLQNSLKSGSTIGGIIKFTNEAGMAYTYKGSYPCSISVHDPSEGTTNFLIHLNFVASNGSDSTIFDYQLTKLGSTAISGVTYGTWKVMLVKQVNFTGYGGPTVLSVSALPDSETTDVEGTYSGDVGNTLFVINTTGVLKASYNVVCTGTREGYISTGGKRIDISWDWRDYTNKKFILYWNGEEQEGLTVDDLTNYTYFKDGLTTKYYKSTPQNILYYFSTLDLLDTLVTASTFYSAGAPDGISNNDSQIIIYKGRTTSYNDLFIIYFTEAAPSQATVAVKYSGSTDYTNLKTLNRTDKEKISFKLGKTTGDTISFYYSFVDNEYKIWQDTASTEMVWFQPEQGLKTLYYPQTAVAEKGYYPQLSWASVKNSSVDTALTFTLSYNVNNTPWTKPFVRWERGGHTYYLRVSGSTLYMATDEVEETVATGGTSLLSFYRSGNYAVVNVNTPADASTLCGLWVTNGIQPNEPVIPYTDYIEPSEGLPRWDFTGKIIGKSDSVAVTSDSTVSKIVALTQAEYDALESKDTTTVYLING